MALPLYLAMTSAEIQANSALPEHMGYMACHFSPYGRGLSNRPEALPAGAALILNDRIPFSGHDPQLIIAQVMQITETNQCSCVLLDFQRPGWEECLHLAKMLVEALACPVGVSELYAQKLCCPVFLPPAPLDTPLEAYLAPWKYRELWLDIGTEGACLTLAETGCSYTPLPCPNISGGFSDEALFIHYTVETAENAARFQLYRTEEDLASLLDQAEQLGVTRCFGLWQELEELNCRESFCPEDRL